MRRPTRHQNPKTSERHPVFDYRPPAYLTAFKWTGISLAVLAVAVAAYVGFWFYTAGKLRDNTLAWIEARRAEGVEVKYGRLDIGGFPFALRLKVEGPALSAPEAKTPWGWEGEILRAEMRPWSPHRVTIRTPGEHAVLLTAEGEPRVYRGKAEEASGRFRFDGEGLRSANLVLGGVTLTEAGTGQAWAVERARLDGELLAREDATHRTPVLDLDLRVNGLAVPDAIPMPLGNRMTTLEFAATLLGPIPEGPLTDSLARWRDDGGTVEVRRLSADYGPLALNADGTLALDGELQPVGSLTAHVEGFFETVDALRNRGIIRAGDAVTAKMILGVLVKRSGDGRTGLNIPVSLQDRHLFAGPVPLIEIPKVTWNGG